MQQNGSVSPQAVRDGLVNSSTTGVVTNAGTASPNRLLYTLGGSTPPPPPPPPPPGCGGLPEQFTGSLAGTGSQIYYTGTAGFTAAAGTHRGCLDGPSGADFDLVLYRKNSSGGWTSVARAEGVPADESITYTTGVAGPYVMMPAVRRFGVELTFPVPGMDAGVAVDHDETARNG